MRRKVFTIILAASAVFSCSRTEEPEARHYKQFNVDFSQIQGDPAYAVSWEKSDSLKEWYTNGKYSLLYPFSKLLGTDPTWVGVTIPAIQDLSEPAVQMKRYGCWTAVSDGSSDEVTLFPRFSLLKINIDASGTMVDTCDVQSVKVSADADISGNSLIDVLNGSVITPSKGRILELTPTGKLSLSEVVSVYAVIYPSTIGHLHIDIPCTGKFRIVADLDVSLTLDAGASAQVDINLAEMLIAGSAEIDVERDDLSSDGTSNCYIISKKGYYKFKPTRGNSKVTPSGMSRVDWLWKDTTSELLEDIALDKNGDVTFWANDMTGNIILAGFDSSDKIVWTWHIWMTEDPTVNFSYGCSTKYKIMDRNLGATSAAVDDVASLGFYYQWGRKDPFIGSNTVGSGTLTKRIESVAFTSGTADFYVNPLYPEHNFSVKANTGMPGGAEIEYTIANPMVFVTGTTWFYSLENLTANATLWGYNGTTMSKSTYDPCPPGWKLSTNNFIDTELKGLTGHTLSSAGLYGYAYDCAEGTVTYLPAAGFRDYSGGYVSYAGSCGQYWGSLYRAKSTDCWSWKAETTNDPKLTHVYASYGLSVRCVSE